MGKQYTFHGGSYDSTEEYYFECCLKEMLKTGFIKSYKRQPPSIKTTEGLKITYTETTQLKTKTKIVVKHQTILQGSEYTPDFLVIWNDKADGVFFQDALWTTEKIVTPFIAYPENANYQSIIECKGSFDRNNMTRLFILNQKFIWDKHRKYVNLVVIPDFFKKIFTPKEYLLTPTGKTKKLNFTPSSLKEYLSDKNRPRLHK